ncbi:CBM96 family carbohydrate-binding protein [Paenibacillus sp. strain BS8-2]
MMQGKRIFLSLLIVGMALQLLFPYGLKDNLKAFSFDAASIGDLLLNEHPRLMATAADFTNMGIVAAQDPHGQVWANKLRADANALVSNTTPVPYNISDGLRWANVDTILNRILLLGIVYKMDGGTAYKDRAWTELSAVAGYANWNTGHYLDTAAVAAAFAIGYDWFYAEWTEAQRLTLETALINKALTPSLAYYNETVPAGTLNWTKVDHNWNFICNAGMMMGALAIADRYPALSEEIVQGGIATLPRAMANFAPDGAWNEGPGYWSYSTIYLTYLFASMESALGTDFGLSNSPGFSETASFPLYMAGPDGQFFNLGDGPSSVESYPQLFWMADRFSKPEYAEWQLPYADDNTKPTHLLWYKPASMTTQNELPLDRNYGNVDISIMRSAWDNKNALFVGMKGGNNRFNHSDLDLGSFVIDVLSERWAEELGSDNYNLPGYFGSNNTRWNYYRKRTEGQNTLVINPSNTPGQNLYAKAAIERSESNPLQAYSILDLTNAYEEDVVSVKRGISLLNHRRQVMIQDEYELKAPGDVLWFMHTSALIEIAPNGKSAILYRDGQRLKANIVSPSTASFSIMDASPLPLSPNPSGQSYGKRKLAVLLNDTVQDTLAIAFTPLREHESEAGISVPSTVPLANWALATSTSQGLAQLQLGGTAIAGFDPDVFTYDLELTGPIGTPPVLAAAAVTPSETVVITPPAQIPGKYEVKVGLSGGIKKTYEVHVTLAPTDTSIRAGSLPVVSASASADDGNVAANTLDDSLTTRWSALGAGQWISFDLGQQRTLKTAGIAWFAANERSTAFKIEVSSDNVSWTEAYNGSSNTQYAPVEYFALGNATARYVRITGYGNTKNGWNSMNEAMFYDVVIEQWQEPVHLTEIQIVGGKAVLQVGEETNLSLQGVMSDGTAANLASASIVYRVGDESRLTVLNGKLHAVSPGWSIAIVYVTLGGYTEVKKIDILVIEAGAEAFSPYADAYVQNGANADTNYGSAVKLMIKDSSPGYARESMMLFDTRKFDGAIQSAKLYVYAKVADTLPTAVTGVYGLGDAEWKETDLTWNNKPAHDVWLADFTANSEGSWHAIDVTPYVTEWHDAARGVGFAFKQSLGGQGAYTEIVSKEGPVNRPYLEIVAAPKETESLFISAAADTYVRDGNHSSAANGAEEEMYVLASAPNYNRESLLKFNVPSMPEQIVSATVGFYAEALENDEHSVNLAPEADTYVRSGQYANTNYGTAARMDIKKDTGADFTREALMKFDTSTLQGGLASAKLMVYAIVSDTGTDPMVNDVFGLADTAWGESTVTWNNRPATGSALQSFTGGRQSAWHEIDITTYAQTKYNAGQDIGLVIKQTPAGKGLYTTIKSKESPDYQPYLRITMTPPGSTANQPTGIPAANELFSTGSAWNESNVAWSSKPAQGTTPIGSFTAAWGGAWQEVDVTSIVQDAALNGGTASFAVKQRTDGDPLLTKIWSKEHGWRAPILRIVYAPLPPADRTILQSTIADVDTVLLSATVGTNPGQYPQVAASELNAALTFAEDIEQDLYSTQAEIDEAVASLQNAKDLFLSRVVPPPPPAPCTPHQVAEKNLLLMLIDIMGDWNSPFLQSIIDYYDDWLERNPSCAPVATP